MEIYDYYKEKYPQFEWESLNHHGFDMAIREMRLCKPYEKEKYGNSGLYRCEIVDNQVCGYLGDTGIKVKGYIDKEVEKEFIESLKDGFFYELAGKHYYTVFWKWWQTGNLMIVWILLHHTIENQNIKKLSN